MDWHNLIHAVLALVFVIGLLLLTLWLLKYCQIKGLNCKIVRSLKSGGRLEVIEQKRLDAKNTVVLLRCDTEEHLLLLGANSNLLLATKPATQELLAHD